MNSVTAVPSLMQIRCQLAQQMHIMDSQIWMQCHVATTTLLLVQNDLQLRIEVRAISDSNFLWLQSAFQS